MRVALVHDYLTQYGGAERVLEVLHGMYPDAPVFTSLYDADHLPPNLRTWDIHTSPLAQLPGADEEELRAGLMDLRDVPSQPDAGLGWVVHKSTATR